MTQEPNPIPNISQVVSFHESLQLHNLPTRLLQEQIFLRQMQGNQIPLEQDFEGSKQLCHVASLMNLLENAGLMVEYGAACSAEQDSVVITRHGTGQLQWQ